MKTASLPLIAGLFCSSLQLAGEPILAAWETDGVPSPSPATLAPTEIHPAIRIYDALSLNGMNGGSLTNVWGTSQQFTTTSKEDAIAAGQYFSVILGPAHGAAAYSIDSILANVRVTEAAYTNPDYEIHGQWQYSLNGYTYEDIGTHPSFILADSVDKRAVGPFHPDGIPTKRSMKDIPTFQHMRYNLHLRLVIWGKFRDPGSPSPAPSFALGLGRLPTQDLQIIGTVLPTNDVTLLAWDTQGLIAGAPAIENLAPTVVHESLVPQTSLTAGPGINLSTALNNAWGGTFNQASMQAAINAGQYYTLELLSSDSQAAIHLERLHHTFRLIESTYNTRAVRYIWQYSLDQGAWNTIGEPRLLSPETTGPWHTNGIRLPGLDLRAELTPNAFAGSIRLRLVSWAESAGNYNLHLGRDSGPDLVITGRAAPLAESSPIPGALISQTPTGPDRRALSHGIVATPSITRIDNGVLVASHDFAGSGAHEDTVRVFRSADNGLTWTRMSTLNGHFHSTIFAHTYTPPVGAPVHSLYLIGRNGKRNHVVIRRSLDEGATWSAPVDVISGGSGTANAPVIHNNRLWIARGSQALSVSLTSGDLAACDGDLTQAAWVATNGITANNVPGWPAGVTKGFFESQIVKTPTGLYVLPKLINQGPDAYTARIRINNASSATFEGFSLMPGGWTKFGVRQDEVTGTIFALTNPLLSHHLADVPPGNLQITDPVTGEKNTVQVPAPGMVRNTLALLASTDLVNWTVRKLILYTPEVATEAFQYPNFLIDGDDLLVVSRTALKYDGQSPDRGHDSNMITFHRVENFRQASRDQVLVASTGNNQVLRYEATLNRRLAPLGPFATQQVNGQPAPYVFDQPFGLAQAPNGEVYVSERRPGGRLVRFRADGSLRGTIVAHNGFGSLVPNYLAVKPGSSFRVLMSEAATGRIYDIVTSLGTPDTGTHVPLIDTGLLSSPQGIATDPTGNLYVADHGNNHVRRFSAAGVFLGNLTTSPSQRHPQALGWDPENADLLFSRSTTDTDHDIARFTLPGGGVHTLYTKTDIGLAPGVASLGGTVYWSDFETDVIHVSTDETAKTREVATFGLLDQPGPLLRLTTPTDDL